MKSLRATELIVRASFYWCETGPLALSARLNINHPWAAGNRGHEARRQDNALMAQFKFLGNGLIPIDIGGLQVIQQTTPLANHHQQPAARAVILFVLLKVFGQVIDALGEQRNLDVSRTGVLFVQLKIAYRLYFRIHTYLLIQSISSSLI
jgi:hypothetical protein